MFKSVLKEIIIILLLIVIIVILLGVLFYDSIPSNKTIPAKVEQYRLAEDVNKELEAELKNIETDEIIKTYQLDATDLEYYEKIKEYNKGKVNPFSRYSTSTGTSNSSSGNSSSSSSSSNSNNNSGNTNPSTSNNNDSTESFINTHGKK